MAAARRKQMEKAFDEIDTNGNGFIERKEFAADMVKGGYNLSDSEKEVISFIF